MTLKAESKVYFNSKNGSYVITIPSKVVTDSKFTFKAGDKIYVSISPLGSLLIQKKEPLEK